MCLRGAWIRVKIEKLGLKEPLFSILPLLSALSCTARITRRFGCCPAFNSPVFAYFQISITFQDLTINAGDLPLISAMSSNATLLRIEVAELVKGSAPFVNEVQRITLVTNDTSPPKGTFSIIVGHDQTIPLAGDVSTADLVAALDQLATLRSTTGVNIGTGGPLSWTVTFISPGPQEMLRSPCENSVDGELSPDCLLHDGSIQIERMVKGSSPASGTFRLRLIPTGRSKINYEADDVRTTAPLAADATAKEVQTALTGLIGGERAEVTVAPNTQAEYGFEWGLSLHDNGESSVESVDVNIDGPGPWCTDGNSGPAAAEIPCEFPFVTGEDGRDLHFNCAGAVGSSLGWCSTSPTIDDNLSWGGCVRCTEGALTSPTIHVESLRRGFRLTGVASQISLALSEAVYHPRAFWNAWVGGHDEVSVYSYNDKSLESRERLSGAKVRSISQVIVAPVNNPPTVTIVETNILAYEGKELYLEDADIWDPDLAERPDIIIRVLLEAIHGTLALGNPSGLTFESGSPEPYSSRRLVVTGPLIKLRVAIRQIYYRPLSGIAAGAAALGAIREVQRLEVMSPLTPTVQSITTSTVKGYIEGNFSLALDCSVFSEAVDTLFPNFHGVSINTIDSYTSVVQSPQLKANAPATGNESMETGIRSLLADCVRFAWDHLTLLAGQLSSTSLGNTSETMDLTEDMLPHRAATAIVSRGQPDLHGSLRWVVTLFDVPQSFPVFVVGSNNLKNSGMGLQGSLYSCGRNSSLSEEPSILIAVVQAAYPPSGPNGSFTLTVTPRGKTTEQISAFASAEDVAVALTALDDVGAIQVSTGPLLTYPPAVPAIGRYWEITFLQSGSPLHVGDLPSLQVNGAGLEGKMVVAQISEVTKGQAPGDSVTIVVNDLGNVGDGGALEASAAWNITIVPQSVAPIVHVDRSTFPNDILKTSEGEVLELSAVEVSHDVAWETPVSDTSRKLHYLVHLTCSRGNVKPTSLVVGRDLILTQPSTVLTTLSGALPDVNRALSSLNYYSPRQYRGVDDVEIAVRVAGVSAEGGWGTANIYVFIDGANDAPELMAPRSLKAKGVSPIALAGISVADDDPKGVVTVTVKAVRGLVFFKGPHQLKALDGSEVRRSIGSVRALPRCPR